MAEDPRALVQKAEATLKSGGGGFSRLFGGSSSEDKYRDAADLYTSAGNAYRIQKQNQEAGQVFERAALIHRDSLKDKDDYASSMQDAYKAYLNTSPQDAVRCLNEAINVYKSKGNFRRAATHQENVAKIYEEQLGNLSEALRCYSDAADAFLEEGSVAIANRNRLKVAELSALEGDYNTAKNTYLAVARECLKNNLMRYSVKDYFMRAAICILASGDMIGAKVALEDFVQEDPSFAKEREFIMLQAVAEACEEGETEKFQSALMEYDRVKHLDKWQTDMLLRVKEQLQVVEPENEFA